jgi:hypothetical protein
MLMKFFIAPFAAIVAHSALLSNNALAETQDIQTAKTIYARLTGSMIYDKDPRLANMAASIASGKPMDAAKIATNDRKFYDSTLRNFSAPWSSKSANPMNTLDDMQATAIGIIRDRLDIRSLLTGTFYYYGKPIQGLPDPSPQSNMHYSAIEDNNMDLSSTLVKGDFPNAQSVGIFQSRGFASEYFSAGTNRRAVKFAFQHFLCRDITYWKEPGLPDTFIRRDVDRKPAGDPHTFQSECRGCHAPMDAMSGAFAKVDFVENKIVFTSDVAAKYNIHADVYPEGYTVTDNYWINYLTEHQQNSFGWRGPTSGNSLEEFASMLANSRAFSECMVRQASKTVCRTPKSASKREAMIKSLSTQLESSNYDLRSIFEALSIHTDC